LIPNPCLLATPLWRYWVDSVISQYIIITIIIINLTIHLASIPVFTSLFLLANFTLWTHINALDASKAPDPPTCPSPPTYTSSPGELRYTGLAVPDQILCVLVNFFTVALHSPAKAHIIHFLVQLLAVVLPLVVERTRDNGSMLISHFVIGTAYQLKGAGVVLPLAYLLIIWRTASVRGSGTKRGTAPLTQRQAESILVSILLGFVLPSVVTAVTLNPYWIALWQPFPWWMSVTQALYLLTVPSPPSSSPSSKPGSGSALFKSTLYTLSTAAAIAHWVFLYHVFTAPSFSLPSLLTFSWLPSLSIPPRDTPHADAFAHFLEWDAVMCYATAFLGALWLLDLARTKTTSVGGWVKEVLGKIFVGVVAGPGAMLCTLWGEREDALVHAWKAEGEKNK